MSDRKRGIMGKVFGVSGAIIASRILGLLRVRLEAEVLGGGAIASAWHLAFALPNLLRRLLGEGALGNALMPIVAEIDEKEGTQDAHGIGVFFSLPSAICHAYIAQDFHAVFFQIEYTTHDHGTAFMLIHKDAFFLHFGFRKRPVFRIFKKRRHITAVSDTEFLFFSRVAVCRKFFFFLSEIENRIFHNYNPY